MSLDLVTPLANLATALKAAGVKANDDPSKVTAPGAWLKVAAITEERLGGPATLRLEIVLVAPDREHRRSVEVLQDLYNKALDVITPSGDTRPTGVNLPDQPGLPGLIVPFDLYPD